MFGRVLFGAAHVPQLRPAQLNPQIAGLQALVTTLSARDDSVNLI